MKKLVNGELVEMTAEEITQKESDDAKYTAQSKSYADEDLAKENLKASARQKLMDGEPLTEDEAKTIVL